jgi:hypothetical protein
MKTFIKILGLLIGLMLSGCSVMGDNAASPIGLEDSPPLPRMESILPMARGNSWHYTNTLYDSATGKIRFDNEDLELAMPKLFWLSTDSQLNEVDPYSYTWMEDDTLEYAYAYEWEAYDRGEILVYRDIDVDTKGIYRIGKYRGYAVYPHQPQLWLKYPADSGDTWTYQTMDTSGTPGDTVFMSVDADSVPFSYIGDSGNRLNPLSQAYCKRYKSVSGTTTSYYLMNDSIGIVGYIRYDGPELVSTFVLSDYRLY